MPIFYHREKILLNYTLISLNFIILCYNFSSLQGHLMNLIETVFLNEDDLLHY